MARIDAYYTPSQLAVQMVNVCSGRPVVIADFAAGDGELLEKPPNSGQGQSSSRRTSLNLRSMLSVTA